MSDHDKAFLTIAIPTYNRPEEIQRQVRNLLPQLIPGKTRLIVFDNVSPIPVETLFTEEEKSRFEIRRNTVNIGGDANIARCLEACFDSEWGYIPGDDDKLFPDTLVRIMQQIEKKPDAIYINFGCKKDERLETEEEYLNSLGNDIFSFGNALWISKGVYHTKKLSDCYLNLYQYGYSFAAQVIFVLSYLKKNKKGTVIRLSTPLFEESAPGGWNPVVYTKRLMSFYYFFEEKNDYYDRFLHNIIRLQLYHIISVIHNCQQGYSFERKDVKRILKQIMCFYPFMTCFKVSPKHFLDVYLYSVSPLLNRLFYSLYVKTKSKTTS